MSLFMLRLEPDLPRAMDWGARNGLLIPGGGDDGYLWHALLKAAFDTLAPKPFRAMGMDGTPHQSGTDTRRVVPHILGYGTGDREALAQHAATFADPIVAAALNLPSLAVKAMPVGFAAGQRLGFEIRLRPIARQTRDGDRTRKRERDVYLIAAEKGDPKPDRDAVYRAWLGELLEQGGAKPEGMRILARQRLRIVRRGTETGGVRALAAHGRQGGGPDIVVEGALTVFEPEAFMKLLARGVGRHRAFGFGMLLLRPVRD